MATYKEAHTWLNQEHPFLYTLVLNLGKGVEDPTISTAAVRLNENAVEGWEFAYNPSYFEPLSAEHAGGVFSHEALHAILGHLKELRQTDLFPNRQALGIAHECIVNDRLTGAGFSLPDNPYYGPEFLGVDTSPYTTEEVYQLVVDKLEENSQEQEGGEAEQDEDSSADGQSSSGGIGQQSSDDSEQDSSGTGAGAPLCDPTTHEATSDALAKREEQNSRTNELLDELQDVLQQAAKEASQDPQSEAHDFPEDLQEELGVEHQTNQRRSLGGTGFFMNPEEASEKLGASKAFVKLLGDVNPDILRRKGNMPARGKASWVGPRRNLHHLYPKVLLPKTLPQGDPQKKGPAGNGKPLMILALDQSASIPRSWAKRLTALAKAVPEDLIEVECCTFSTHAVRFDIHKERNNVASGGTDFSCVEEFAREAARKHKLTYPKAVVVLTDGEAKFKSLAPTQEQLDKNWTWLLLNSFNVLKVQQAPGETVRLLQDYFTF